MPILSFCRLQPPHLDTVSAVGLVGPAAAATAKTAEINAEHNLLLAA